MRSVIVAFYASSSLTVSGAQPVIAWSGDLG